MNEASDISEYPYVFTHGTFDPEYLEMLLSTRFDLVVITPILRILHPASENKVFMFELNQLKFKPEPCIRDGVFHRYADGVFSGHSYRICNHGKSISFGLLLSGFYFYNGLKSLKFPEMSNPDFRDKLFRELAAKGVPTAAEVIPEQV